LLNLINEVLDLSKIEAGKMDLKVDRVDRYALIQNVFSLFKTSIEAKGLEFIVEEDGALPSEFMSDQLRIEQVIKNLLSNAVKFTKKGSIKLSIIKPPTDYPFFRPELNSENSLMIAVEDTGIGISPEKQKLIFEAFQQEDGSTSRKYGGTGLGLSISKELAKILGGELHLESDPGSGSCFSLVLPIGSKSKEADPDKSSQNEVDKTTKPPPKLAILQSETTSVPEIKPYINDDRENIATEDQIIVVVEDDPKFAKILIDQCHKKGFKGLAAETGEAGIQLIIDHQPSAVILDIKLPGMDGWAVLDELKKNPKTRHIPVHMMSALQETIDAFHKGAIGYLRKPVSTADLQQAFVRIEEFIQPEVKHLLIVEDNPQMRQTIRKVVKGKDIKIKDIGTGQDCLQELQNNHFDCVILDLCLPDMDGFELLQEIRSDKSIEVPPIIVYTGQELSKEQDNELRKYTKSIIIKGVRSEERLLDETALFLHRVVEDLTEQQQQIIKDLYKKETQFEGKTILIVDDDMRNVFALTRVFEEKGMKVIKAENGKKAIECLETSPIVDLVLMDIMMPEMDGYEAMTEIRKLGQYKELPIIALTAKAMKEDKQKCLDAGASDYITKPVDVSKLMSLIRVWLHN